MNKTSVMICIIAVLAVAAISCAQKIIFEDAVARVNEIDSRHGATMTEFPFDLERLELMEADINGLKSLKLTEGGEAFNLIINFKLAGIEAEKLINQSQKYGLKGTVELGFGCKSRPFIIETGSLKQQSAEKGAESVDALSRLLSNYPEESKKAGITQKEILFRNATFFRLFTDGQKAIKTAKSFCTENRTLELYQEAFRKSTNFSEDYINNLDYEKAAEIWIELHG
ncbi:MAG TPA: hypothetical protein VI564_03585 [Candidatus Nanoarchaeia archaeon]|nr:hypothetical protein [Candidatus Nanoarchaeia archaeon]